jgi:5'-3' exonuclease
MSDLIERKKLLDLLDKQKTEKQPPENRILIVDGLNLFFRNFAILNKINPDGEHVGGLGGFFRSLGFLINQIVPDEVYIVFDGEGSTINKKNLLPEYKAKRNLSYTQFLNLIKRIYEFKIKK